MVQVTLKTLKGETFQVEVNATDKVSDLKAKVSQARPELPPDCQKLIYCGKILADEATVEESGYQSSGFIVAMATKAKPAATPAAETPAPTPAPAPAAATPAPAPAPTPAAAPPLDAASVNSLCEMGFPREEVERALRAANGNTMLAAEYLMSGIPEPGPPGPMPGMAPGGAPGAGGLAFPAVPGPGAGGPPGGGEPLPEALAQLRNNPQFNQLAAMVAGNPQMLAQVLQGIEQSHPEIAQAIQENPEAFMRLLQEVTPGGGQEEAGGLPLTELMNNPEALQAMLPQILPEIEAQDPAAAAAIRENPQLLLQMLAQQGGMGGMPGMGPGGGGPQVIRLSEEENAAVERLAALGFDKEMAAQAYLACDKNEELAANFLFDNAGS